MLCGRAPFQPASKKEPVTAFMDRIRAGNFTMEGMGVHCVAFILRQRDVSEGVCGSIPP